MIYKVITTEDAKNLGLIGFVPDQPADKLTPAFIHACDRGTIPAIIEKFYQGVNVTVLGLDKEFLQKDGFRVVWECNRPNGQFYWHIYRDTPDKLIHTRHVVKTVRWDDPDFAELMYGDLN